MITRGSIVASLVMLVLAFLASAQLASDAPKAPASQTAVDAKDAKFVADTIGAIDANKPETLAAAQKALVDKGASIVPAVQAALPGSTGPARQALEGALVTLVWKTEPAKVIKDWVLSKNKDFKAELPPAVMIVDDSLTKKFGDFRFYLIAYRSFPVAMMPPAPLAGRNIFILTRDGKVEHVTTADGLKKFFMGYFPAVASEDDCKDAVNAWLRLSTEIHSDGMMRFAFPQDRIKVTKTDNGWEATGTATLGGGAGGGPLRPKPVAGDRGTLDVAITFDAKGKITNIAEEVNIQAGMRPICQATKLLDPDPIVRRMARQDLLMMGTAANEYMMEQRAKASPELAAEIDKVWQEILDREKQWNEWNKGK
ncbi:MAG: hypothetical protein ACE15C_12635 [Phycisphaerae bacterium]